MRRRRVFISGMGAAAPNGTSVPEFWLSCRNGVSGLSAIDSFDTRDHRARVAGLVRGIDRHQHRPNISEDLYDRVSVLAKIAADEALQASELSPATVLPGRIGIILGQGLSGMQSVENWNEDYFVHKTGIVVDDFVASFPNTPAAILAIEYNIRGLNYTLNTACSSSAAAVGLSALLIRNGMIDVCLAGGADAPVTPATLKSSSAIRSTS